MIDKYLLDNSNLHKYVAKAEIIENEYCPDVV